MSGFSCKKVLNCFVSKFSFQYTLEQKITDPFLEWLESICTEFTCRRDFPRPYFNGVLEDGSKVKGVIGDIAFKVNYPDASHEESKLAFEAILTKGLEGLG